MIKVLLKKQLGEIFKAYFFDMKKNKARSKVSTALYFLLFAVLMLIIMTSVFGSLAYVLSPIITLGFGWLYFAMISLISVLFGVFGSVFSTYQGLYLSKDNDLLLSMPVPVRAILVSRLLGVYLMGLLYSAVVIIPAIIVYCFTVTVNLQNIIGSIIFTALISLFVLALSCIFGYAVARISLKLKNKSFITVIIALLFFAGYYFVYFKANAFLSALVNNITVYGARIKKSAYPVYIIGRACEGEIIPLIAVSAIVIAVLSLTLYVISKSFIKIATSTNVVARVKYKQKRSKAHSLTKALILRELKRFTSSPNYMLNCGLGAVFLMAAGVFVIVKAPDLRNIIYTVLLDFEQLLCLGAGVAVYLIISMNDIATPSVSLEGKTLWQIRSLPVKTNQVLKAKILFQICFNAVPAVFGIVCFIIALLPDVITSVLMIMLVLSYVVLHAFFSLYCGLHKVNLNWTNEIVPIKQGINVLFAIFGSFIISIAAGGLYFAIGIFVGVKIYMLLLSVANSLFSLLIYSWINKKGTRIFEAL